MENFNLKKFLVENKLTTSSRTLNENIQLSPEAQDEVEGAIESWVPEDVEQTSDHMGEMITQALEEIDGIEIPEGMFNNSMHNALLALSKEFHGGQIELPAAVIKAVSIAMDPKNYGKGIQEENAIEGQDVSGQVVTHATEALKAIEKFKAANQISSNESDFNEIEAMLEEIIERLK